MVGAAVALSTLLVISPIVIRNVVVFYPQIAPTGLGFGWNLWAGIGETSRGPNSARLVATPRWLSKTGAT